MNLMKNFLSHFSSKRLFFFSILISGLFAFSSSEVSAQTNPMADGAFEVPQGNFVDVATAIIRLENAHDGMKVQLSNMDPTSQAYLDLESKRSYFNTISGILVDGKETDSKAVANAIAHAMLLHTTDAYGVILKTKLIIFKQDAINLLKI
jgi:hypothetical protein